MSFGRGGRLRRTPLSAPVDSGPDPFLPSTAEKPVGLFDHDTLLKAGFDVALSAAIDDATRFFRRDLRKLLGIVAMVHSTIMLVDPLGKEPIVFTLGPRASGKNDEDLLGVRRAIAIYG